MRLALNADQVALLPAHEREAFTASLSAREQETLRWCWEFWARPEQLPPTGDWGVWLILAGRGFGKTRTGAEWVRSSIRQGFNLVNLAGATADDARDVMVEGESGILSICPNDERPRYLKSERKLLWPNGATSLIFTADEPDRFRGKQHQRLWADECAAWRYSEAWDQAMLGLRLGRDPMSCVTTTPRPTDLIKDLIKSPDTFTTTGSTYDNKVNLAPKFFSKLIKKYEGTRLGRQELLAQILDDNPEALWQRSLIDKLRVRMTGDLVRVVVAVDPQAGTEGAETGIIVCGLGRNGHGYVLDDMTVKGTPAEWGTAACVAYDKYKANYIIAENNQGGTMVEHTIHTVDPHAKYKGVRATDGKRTRAEPVAALYEAGMIHHVGSFAKLEDQQCLVGDTLVATETGERPIRDIQVGDRVWTRQGLRKVEWAGQTGQATTLTTILTNDRRRLLTTVCHPVYTKERGFVPASTLLSGETLELNRWKNEVAGDGGQLVKTARPGEWGSMALKSSGTVGCGVLPKTATTGTPKGNSFTGRCGRKPTGQFRPIWTSTIRTATSSTTNRRTWRRSHAATTSAIIRVKGLQRWGQPNEAQSLAQCGGNDSRLNDSARGVESHLRALECGLNTAPGPAPRGSITSVTKAETDPTPVYNLTVEDVHEFFANGILVHNCQWTPSDKVSPDRMDALVWGFTELMIGDTRSRKGVGL